MLTSEIRDLINLVLKGQWNSSHIPAIERQDRDVLVADLEAKYPIVFQERTVGHKREIGLANAVRWELTRRTNVGSLFPTYYFLPTLRQCVFVSSYNNQVSEITTVASIGVIRKKGDPPKVKLRMGPGFMLDKGPDNWEFKRLTKRSSTLSESLLLARGWRFAVFELGKARDLTI